MSNKVEQALEFIEVHDGSQPELSETEKLLAAESFKNLCFDLILINLDKVYEQETGEAYTETCLDFMYKANDGSYLDITVSQSIDSSRSVVTSCYIFVAENSANGDLGSDYYYSINEGELEVLRHDSLRFDESTSAEVVIHNKRKVSGLSRDEFMINEFINYDLERRLGMNDQPVSIKELEQLRAIIEVSEVCG